MSNSRVFVSTDMVEEKYRNDFWTTLTSPMYEASLVEDQQEKFFRGSVSSQLVGRLEIGQTEFNAQRYQRTRREIIGSDLDGYMLQLFTSGALVGDFGGTSASVRPGDICISDLRREATTKTSVGSSLAVMVPRDVADCRIQSKLHGVVLDAAEPTTRILTDFMRSLNSLPPSVDLAASDQVENALSALISASASTNRDISRLDSPVLPVILRDRIYELIDENLLNAELGPEMLMQRLHVSRAHLYRAVADDGGISTLIRNRRLDAAYAAIRSVQFARHSIEQICFHFGFSSANQFLRNFKARFGETPGSVRANSKSQPDGVPSTVYLHKHFKRMVSVDA